MASKKNNLHDSAFEGNISLVREFVDSGVDLEKLCKEGSNPLQLAVLGGHLEVVEFLLDSKANVNAIDSDGFSVLQNAIMAAGLKPQKRIKLIELLIGRGADTNHQSKLAGGLLETAANYRRSVKVKELLIKHGAKE